MGEHIIAWLQERFYVVMITVGVLIVVGCLRNWKWISRMQSSSDLAGTRAFVEGLHGRAARHKFERGLMFLVGVTLIITGALYWWLMSGDH